MSKWYKVKVACYNSCIFNIEVIVRAVKTEEEAKSMVRGMLFTRLDATEITSVEEIEDQTRD